ncbi:MAG: hypothetical protein R3C44_05520 [Chloroflexota bacterium]
MISPSESPTSPPRDTCLHYFLGGGMVLAVLAAFSTFEVRRICECLNPLAITRLGLEPVMLVVLLLYFLTASGY